MNIPTEWTAKSIKFICLRTEQWIPRKDKRDSFHYIDVSSVSNSTFTIKDTSLVKADAAPGRARKIVKWQDTIFATIRPSLKRVAFIPQEYDNQIASTAFCVVRPNQKQATPLYVYYFLLSDLLNTEINGLQHGASYPAITDKDVLNQTIPIPPLTEQQKIAAVLFKIQQAIKIQESIIEKMRELKKSTMHHVFTQGLRGEKLKETEIGLMPESWDPIKIGDCCDIRSSTVSFNELNQGRSDDNDVLCYAIKVSDMNLPGNEKYIFAANIETELSSKLVSEKGIPANSVIFPKRGAAIATNKKRLTTLWSLLDPNLIAIIPRTRITSEFLYYWFLTFDLASIQDLGPTPQLNKKDVEPISIPCPSDSEQFAISNIFRSIDQKIDLHTAKKSAMQNLFKTMLNKLMTGDIRVKDLDIDVSEVSA